MTTIASELHAGAPTIRALRHRARRASSVAVRALKGAKLDQKHQAAALVAARDSLILAIAELDKAIEIANERDFEAHQKAKVEAEISLTETMDAFGTMALPDIYCIKFDKCGEPDDDDTDDDEDAA